MMRSVSGYEDVAIGQDAFSAYTGAPMLTSGQNSNGNVVIGVSAGKAVIRGRQNVIIGSNAQTVPTVGATFTLPADIRGVTAIGYLARAHGDYSVAVGYEADATTNQVQLGWNGGGMALKVGNGNVTVTASSRRWKTEISALGVAKATDLLEQIDPVEFTFIENSPGLRDGERHVGFIAEDVASAGMFVETDDDGPSDISDRDLIAVLWRVVKDQQARLHALESAT